MTRLLNIREQADIDRLMTLYPYRDEQGYPVLDESFEEYAKRTNQSVIAVKRQADRLKIPVIQDGRGSRRRVNLYALFLKTIRSAERYVK